MRFRSVTRVPLPGVQSPAGRWPPPRPLSRLTRTDHRSTMTPALRVPRGPLQHLSHLAPGLAVRAGTAGPSACPPRPAWLAVALNLCWLTFGVLIGDLAQIITNAVVGIGQHRRPDRPPARAAPPPHAAGCSCAPREAPAASSHWPRVHRAPRLLDASPAVAATCSAPSSAGGRGRRPAAAGEPAPRSHAGRLGPVGGALPASRVGAGASWTTYGSAGLTSRACGCRPGPRALLRTARVRAPPVPPAHRFAPVRPVIVRRPRSPDPGRPSWPAAA